MHRTRSVKRNWCAGLRWCEPCLAPAREPFLERRIRGNAPETTIRPCCRGGRVCVCRCCHPHEQSSQNSAPSRVNTDIPTPSPADHVTQQEMEVIQQGLNEPIHQEVEKEKGGFGIGLSVIAACAFLFWLAITSEEGSQWLPSMQEKVTKALQISASDR